jgi:hypothetical protein
VRPRFYTASGSSDTTTPYGLELKTEVREAQRRAVAYSWHGDARRFPMKCPKCEWPMRLTGTKKVLTSFLATFKCLNSKCQHGQTEIARSN